MKKKISLLLAMIMTLSVFSINFPAVAEEISKENAISIGNEIAKMCAEYDDYSIETYSQNSDDKTINTRLIVKTDDTIDEYGAIDSVYGLGYAFLQYDDEETASTAFNKYEKDGYTVSYDTIITFDSVDNSEVISDEEQSLEYEWITRDTDVDSTLDYYKYRINSQIVVGILDTGIDYNITNYKNRIIRTNTDFSSSYSNDEMDYDGHGTGVSSMVINNSPDNVKVKMFKVSDNSGNSKLSMILLALSYISELNDKPEIINMSFGLDRIQYEPFKEAIDNLVDDGVVFTVAAGNESARIDEYDYPASLDNVITVSSVNKNGQPSSFSNYGVDVDISAPGESVLANGLWASGTSFSAPFVAAAAAIVLMENKNYTPAQVKEKLTATATPFKRSDCNNLYGAGIVNFSNIINGTRCKDVTTNYQSGVYRNDISVELKCDNSLVDIYYTTDGTLPTKTNGTKYTAPIDVTETTRIIAAAFARIGSTLHSKYTSLDYYILKNGEDEYIIDDNGTILNYLGSEIELNVPETVNGITPTSISQKCFQYKDIKNIVLPDTVTKIDECSFRGTNLETIIANGAQELKKYCFEGSQLKNADFPNVVNEYYAFNNTPIVSASLPNLDYAESGFYNCDKLSSVYLPNLRAIYYEAFYGCSSLTQELKLPKLESIGYKPFANSYFKSIILPMCREITDTFAFENAAAESIVLGKITSYPDYAFNNCVNLKNLYVPKLTGISGEDFNGCNKLEMIFAPMLKGLTTSITNNVTVYCGERFVNFYYSEELSNYNYTFICPEYTPALSYMNGKKYADLYDRISSDEMVNEKGRSIRVKNAGLRFGFNWDEISQIEQFAEDIEYGFIYHYNYDNEPYGSDELYINNVGNDNIKLKKATNLDDTDGNNTTFNLVFTNIPDKNQNTNISVRAYICIDGMYFYSNTLNGSYSDVANCVLNDDEINEEIKSLIKNTLVTEA